MSVYGRDFYAKRYQSTSPSARAIIPIVLEKIKAKSVIDIGCGIGAWLSIFKEHGVDDILGVDGSWVDENELKIPSKCFLKQNLTQPIRVERRFDLAVSLEVAEHIPMDLADAFVSGLTELAPAVLFSAAIPFQGGICHINEQWPDFWDAIFKKKEYLVLDFIRKRVWRNSNVLPHYAQNILLFVRRDYLENNTLLKEEYESEPNLSIVHPDIYLSKIAELESKNKSGREILKQLPLSFLNFIKKKARNF